MFKKIYTHYKNLLTPEYVAQNPEMFKKHLILYIASELLSFFCFYMILVFGYYVILSFFPHILGGFGV